MLVPPRSNVLHHFPQFTDIAREQKIKRYTAVLVMHSQTAFLSLLHM